MTFMHEILSLITHQKPGHTFFDSLSLRKAACVLDGIHAWKLVSQYTSKASPQWLMSCLEIMVFRFAARDVSCRRHQRQSNEMECASKGRHAIVLEHTRTFFRLINDMTCHTSSVCSSCTAGAPEILRLVKAPKQPRTSDRPS